MTAAVSHRERMDGMRAYMRTWRSLIQASGYPPPPPHTEPIHPSLAVALGLDTPQGRERFERGRALRGAGYQGPLNTDNRIPDPDDPGELPAISALVALAATREPAKTGPAGLYYRHIGPALLGIHLACIGVVAAHLAHWTPTL